MLNINRQSLQVLSNRMTKKDTARYLGVSPSTVYRWLARKPNGSFKLKKVNTKKDYSNAIDTFKKDYGKKRTVKKISEKIKFTKKNEIDFTDFFHYGHTKEYRKIVNSDHVYYESSKFDKNSLYNKAVELCQSNVDSDYDLTKLMIKLYGDIKRYDGARDTDFLSTDLWGCSWGSSIDYNNISAMIENAFKLKFEEYDVNNITKIMLVEVINNDRDPRPDQPEN